MSNLLKIAMLLSISERSW